MPLCFTPPCGTSGMPAATIASFTNTQPASMRLASAAARCVSRLQMLAASPNSLAFASATASSASLTFTTGNSGPNVSS